MTRLAAVKAFLQSISFRELTLSINLLASTYIGYFYLQRVFYATPEQLASATWLSELLLQVIIYSIAIMVISYIVLAVVSDNELAQPLDVREKQINLVGYKYTAYILQAGICIAIFQYQAEAQGFGPSIEYNIPFLPLHIMISAFLLAEIANYSAQLYKGRTGDIYE